MLTAFAGFSCPVLGCCHEVSFRKIDPGKDPRKAVRRRNCTELTAIVMSAHCSIHIGRLKDHFVWPLVAPQAEARSQIALEFRNLLDVCHERLVHLLLVVYPLGVCLLLLWGLAVLEEALFSLFLLARPVLVLADAVDDLLIDSSNIDESGCGDHIAVVYAADGNAIGLEGAGDEEHALLELAKQNHALTAEAAREEDENGAGCEGLAVFGGVCGLAGLSRLVSSQFVSK